MRASQEAGIKTIHLDLPRLGLAPLTAILFLALSASAMFLASSFVYSSLDMSFNCAIDGFGDAVFGAFFALFIGPLQGSRQLRF